MEPPQYTEYGKFGPRRVAIHWNKILPYITPQNITPQIYEALLVLSKSYLRRYAKAKRVATITKREFDYSAHASELTSSRILWEIVHTFSESRSF